MLLQLPECSNYFLCCEEPDHQLVFLLGQVTEQLQPNHVDDACSSTINFGVTNHDK